MDRLTKFLAPAALGALVALASLVALGPPPAAAQSLWIPRDRDHAVMLEYLRPAQEGINGDLFSGAAFLSGRVSLSPHVALVAELPMARERGRWSGYYMYPGYYDPYDYYYPYGPLYYPSPSSRVSAGNPYLGVESRPGSIPIFWEFGFRAPLASEKNENYPAVATGFLADVTRSDAFQPRTWTVQTAFNVAETSESGVDYRLRLSPLLDIYSSRYGGTRWAYLYAVYAWEIGYRGAAARVGTAISGRTLLNHTYGNVARNSLNQIELHADFLSGPVRPGLDFRLPLAQGAYAVAGIAGGSVSMSW
jgi:hypothetical protein